MILFLKQAMENLIYQIKMTWKNSKNYMRKIFHKKFYNRKKMKYDFLKILTIIYENLRNF